MCRCIHYVSHSYTRTLWTINFPPKCERNFKSSCCCLILITSIGPSIARSNCFWMLAKKGRGKKLKHPQGNISYYQNITISNNLVESSDYKEKSDIHTDPWVKWSHPMLLACLPSQKYTTVITSCSSSSPSPSSSPSSSSMLT